MLSARYLLLIAVAGVAAIAGVLTVQGLRPDGRNGSLEAQAVGEMAAFKVSDGSAPLPPFPFKDGTGRTLSLAEFEGRVVLLNVWATWCAPCLVEMPTLDRLQEALGGDNFEVVALALDQSGTAAAKTMFVEKLKLSHLKFYVDESAKAARPLGVIGMPTTILIDRHGVELGRLSGPADWDSAQAKRLIEAVLVSENSRQGL